MTFFGFSHTTEDGEDTKRTVTFRDTTYDLTDRPLLHTAISLFGLSVFAGLFLAAFLLAATTISTVTPLSAAIHFVIDIVLTALAFWLALAGIKYLLTGTTEPFMTININRSDTTTTDENSNNNS